MTTDPSLAERAREQFLWRYMSFSRFIWLLAEKSLWMARADRLEDLWEMSFSEAEIDAMMEISSTGLPVTDEMKRGAKREFIENVNRWRGRTFVNCWTGTDGESHAMWSVYCGAKDGVAIRTTLKQLQGAVSSAQVLQVNYSRFDPSTRPKTPKELISRKRKPYSYEEEWRVVSIEPEREKGTIGELIGFPEGNRLPWNPEEHVERVLVHPAADPATVRAIKAVVERLAPSLVDKIEKSGMAEVPPR